MNKKAMISSFGWPVNFLIIIGAVVLAMLIILFICALFIKSSESKDVLSYFDSDFLKKASDYNRTVLLVSVLERFMTWAFMGLLLFLLWNNVYMSTRVHVMLAALIFFLFTLALFLFLLPLQYYQEFAISHRFGLSNQTLSAWFVEAIKEGVLYMIISTIGLTAIYAVMIHSPKYWWIIAIAVFIVFIVFANFIFPILIDPLFYKFEPLKDAELEKEILLLAESAKISVGSILVADASRKTNKVNAYFTGIGKSKRIVIYDNLLNKYSKKEVLSVIAHEMGHWKYMHIAKNIAIGIAGMVILFFIMFILKGGLNMAVSARLVLILFIAFSLIAYMTNPLSNMISRHFEVQADMKAAELTGDSGTQIEMLQKLARSNLSYVSPSGVLKFLIYTHPPIMDRINYVNKFDKPN
ncbi:MAG: M48 family metallopeptidase [Actinomycetota bacterium]|nr:M48 family metallopeptidase [Actinomycetota bacterium]